MSSRKNIFFSSLVALICLIFSEWGKIYFLEKIKTFDGYQPYIKWITCVSAISYIIISYLSDIWSRKKILWLSVLFLILALVNLYWGNLILVVVFFSLAPVTSVARAAYCDIHLINKREPNVINTILFQSLPWLFLPSLDYSKFRTVELLFIFGVITLMIVILIKDRHDKDIKKKKNGLMEAIKKYGFKTCILIASAFFLINWAWSLFFYRLEDTHSIKTVSKYLLFAPGWAFFGGIIFSKVILYKNKVLFFHFKNPKMDICDNPFKLLLIIFFGVIPFLIAINLMFVFFKINNSDSSLLHVLPELTLLGGFIIPLIYSFFSSRVGYHSLGLIFATIETIQSLSEALGAWCERIVFLKDFYLIIFALFITIISTVLLKFLPKRSIELNCNSLK